MIDFAKTALARAWQNECDGWMALGSIQGSPYRVVRDNGVIYAWWEGAPGVIDHYIMMEDGFQGDLQSVLASVTECAPANGSATTVRFSDHTHASEWGAQAVQLGFMQGYTVPVMVCRLQDYHPTLQVASAITTQKVGDASAYQQAFDVIHAVYGGDPSLTRFFNPYGRIGLYTGYWNQAPVSAATVWPFAGVAGIYSVATLPEYRQRGLALATIQHALNDAVTAGHDLAVLRTVDELVPFYEQLGFRMVGKLHSWTKA